MKASKLIGATLLAFGATATHADPQIGVSVSISQPGVYGRIDIGSGPPPVLMYPQPVIISQPVRVVSQPVYMHVPPGHAKDWGKHCHKYGACSTPVYFVAEQQHPAQGHGNKGKGRGHKHD